MGSDKMRKKCECKDYCEEAMEEQERFNELSRYDRKLEKIYEAILDVQDRIDAQIRYQREEELKIEYATDENNAPWRAKWDVVGNPTYSIYEITKESISMKTYSIANILPDTDTSTNSPERSLVDSFVISKPL